MGSTYLRGYDASYNFHLEVQVQGAQCIPVTEFGGGGMLVAWMYSTDTYKGTSWQNFSSPQISPLFFIFFFLLPPVPVINKPVGWEE